jgi:hypothetical protein
VITIAVIGLAVILAAAALGAQGARRDGTSTLYLAVATTPLFLTMVVPAPFALLTQAPAGWARRIVFGVTRVGFTLSVILLAAGAVLTIRALLIGDRRGAVVLALETALAGLPAGIVAIYASLFRLL